MRVLVVDDSRAMQQIIRRSILKMGRNDLDIRLASSAKEAMEITQTWMPEVALLDWHMPERNGLELMSDLAMLMADIEFGFITTETKKERLEAAIEAGASFVINKPFKTAALHEELEPIFEKTKDLEQRKEQQIEDELSNSQGLVVPSKDSLERAFNLLSVHEVRVGDGESEHFSEDWLPCLVGLFSYGHSRIISSVIVLDIGGAFILGSGVSEQGLLNIAQAKSEKVLSEPVANQCEKAMQMVSMLIGEADSENPLELKQLSVVNSNINKLESIMNQRKTQRVDYELWSQALGTGRMVLLMNS